MKRWNAKMRLFWATAALSLALLPLSAAPAEPVSPPAPYNFLIVVDTSQSMSLRKPVAVKVTRELIQSGFHRQMHPGDTLDLWTFDSESRIERFPPQLWERPVAPRIAVHAAQFLHNVKFQGKSRFANVAKDLKSAVAHTETALVVLITDADAPVSGLPFDLELNERLALERKKKPSLRQIFVVSMLAEGGQFTSWHLNAGGDTVELLSLPERPEPVPILAAAPAPVTAAPEPAAPEPEKIPEPPMVFNFPPGARVTAAAPLPPEAATAEPAGGAFTHLVPEANLAVETPSPEIEASPRLILPAVPKAQISEPSALASHPSPAPAPALTPTAPAKADLAAAAKTAPSLSLPPTPSAVSSAPSKNKAAETNFAAAPRLNSTNHALPVLAKTAPPAPPTPPAGDRALTAMHLTVVGGMLCIGVAGVMMLRRREPRHQLTSISRSLHA